MTTTTITATVAESSAVTFGGALVGAYFIAGDPLIASIGVGLVALFAALGYHAAAGNLSSKVGA